MEFAAKDQDEELTEPLLAALLDHPLRARLAAELAGRIKEPAELAKTLEEPLALVAYHFRVLAASRRR